MKNITFLLDSGSDYEAFLSPYLDFPVKVVPLPLFIDNEEHLDGVTISKNAFYKKLENLEDLPKTSQPSPNDFLNAYKEELKKGNEILYIGISSKLSGTFQTAKIAREMLSVEEQQKVYLVDSLTVSAAVLMLLFKANTMLKEKLSLDKVVGKLEELRNKTKLFALLDTLENLKKGGRISSTQAAIGNILNIKPFIAIEDGIVKSLDKFRGRKKGLRAISTILNDMKSKIDHKLLFIAHSYTSDEKLKEECKEIDFSSFKEIIYLKLGSVIGTHAGTNTIGIVYQSEE